MALSALLNGKPSKARTLKRKHAEALEPDLAPVLEPFPLPTRAEDMSLWAFVLLQRSAALFGEHFVQERLRKQTRMCYELFAGVMCLRKAWEAIEQAALELWGIECKLKFSFAVEKESSCKRLIKDLYPSKCLFADILGLVENPPAAGEPWVPRELRLKKKAFCEVHKTMCPLPLELPDGCGLMGPPCILFSKYGKREGFANAAKRQCHDVATRFMQRSLVCLHENVEGFEEAYLDEHLKMHHRQSVVLDPHLFGQPNSRPRSWRVCYRKDKLMWTAPYTLQQIAHLMLANPDIPLKLDFHSYFVERSVDFEANGVAREDDLTKSQVKHLEKYRWNQPSKKLYDLSANVDKRRRVELRNRSFPCLTTSSFFWSEKHQRTMSPREQLHVLGYPCWGPAAATQCVDYVDTTGYAPGKVRHWAGNGMNLANAGFCLLMLHLFVEEKR